MHSQKAQMEHSWNVYMLGLLQTLLKIPVPSLEALWENSP